MGRFNLKALQERAISAAVLIPVVLFAVIWGGIPFYIMIALLFVISAYEWVSMVRKIDDTALHVLWGLVYLAVGFLCCIVIREEQSLNAAILFVVMVWSADIGAYFAGKYFGGAKLAPLISPNKTWAGLGGACDSAGLVAVLYYLGVIAFSFEAVFSWMALIFMFFVGVMIAIVAQGGDLLISFMKRKAGVKDTGALIPGHGGLLDRIDSLLLAAPVFFVLTSFFSFNL